MKNKKDIVEFYPKGKGFDLRLDKYECYKKASGKCSLDIIDDYSIFKESGNRNDISYCPYYCNLIRKNGYKPDLNPVSISRDLCNHYSVDNGRHRVCIMAHENKPMYIHITYSNSECCICTKLSSISRYAKIYGKRRLLFDYVRYYIRNKHKKITYL